MKGTGAACPNRGIHKMKQRAICLIVSTVSLLGLATAQNSQVRSSSTRTGSTKTSPDSLHKATKPLTPKSAMPTHHKSAAGVPKASTSTGKTNAELTHLERQPIKAKSSNSGIARAPKGASAPRPADQSASGSAINFNYQKPATPPPPQVPKKN